MVENISLIPIEKKEDDREFIVSATTLKKLLRAEWLEKMIGDRVFYQICKELEIDSFTPSYYAEDRLSNFVQYNPKLP